METFRPYMTKADGAIVAPLNGRPKSYRSGEVVLRRRKENLVESTVSEETPQDGNRLLSDRRGNTTDGKEFCNDRPTLVQRVQIGEGPSLTISTRVKYRDKAFT